MENTQNYIKSLYAKIDDLIKTQNSIFKEGDDDKHWTDIGQKENTQFTEFMEVQREINRYYDMIVQSKDRAMKQICYNQLMIQNALKDGRKSKEMKDYIFLTINPPNQLPYKKLIQAVEDFTSLVVVKWAHYVFEQRGTEEGEYRGFHTHILFQRDRRPSEVEKAIYRIFMPLVPDRQKIKWWSQDKIEEIRNAYGYITGHKKSEDKQDATSNNINMRRDFGLDQIYTVGEPPLLVGGSHVAQKKILLKKKSML